MKKNKRKSLYKNISSPSANTPGQSYHGGSLRRPAFVNWNTSNGDANTDTIYDLPELRSRSRDLARNAPIGGAAINTVVNNVIGTGLSLQADPDIEYLGWSNEQATAFKREVEAEFKLWGESLDCDTTRALDFYGLQSLALRSMLESGDVFAITPTIKRTTPYTLTIQLIEADRVLNKDYEADSNKKMAGITLDQFGAPSIYDIARVHPGSIQRRALEWTQVRAYGQNGRKNVLHLFERRRPGQVRGVPYLSSVIEPLKQLQRYSDAELQAAVVSAALAIFVKMDADSFDSLFDGTSKDTYIKNATGWNGKVSMDMDTAGRAVNLLPGESIEVPDLGRPNSNFDGFFLAMLKQIGPVLEIPFEVLTKHFSSSYSASRAALLDFWRFVRVRRDFMATYFCDPIKELWFEEAVSKGRITAPGFFSDPRTRQAYTRVQWIGDSQGSIDPVKDANAAEKRIALGISTREKESTAFDGGDWQSNHRQLVKENAARAEFAPSEPSEQNITEELEDE